jgi:hypothetical protein
MEMQRLGRMAVALFVSLSLLVANGTTAGAAVVFNGRFDVGFTTVENSCSSSDGPVAVTGFVHVVSREQNGTFYTHNNWRFTGISANGTRYEGSRIIETANSTDAFSYSSRTRWISHGSSDNTHVTFTAQFPPGTFSMEIDCRG